MRTTRAVLLLAAACLSLLCFQSSYGKAEHAVLHSRRAHKPARHANPFIGSAGVGHVTPGAHAPFGMITLAPLTGQPQDSWEHCSGYQRTDHLFRGVAHTALSGAGITLGLDFAVSPFRDLGVIEVQSAFPGYYSATVSEGDPTLAEAARVEAARVIRRKESARVARDKARALIAQRRVEAAVAGGGATKGSRQQQTTTTTVRRDEARRRTVLSSPSPPPPPPPPPTSTARVSFELAAGTRYGIHRYVFEPGATPRLYFRDVEIKYAHASELHGGRKCAIEGRKSVVSSQWARYTIFFYAELSSSCNADGASREAAAVAAAEEAERRRVRAIVEAAAEAQRRVAEDSYEGRMEATLAHLLDTDAQRPRAKRSVPRVPVPVASFLHVERPLHNLSTVLEVMLAKQGSNLSIGRSFAGLAFCSSLTRFSRGRRSTLPSRM